MSFGRRFLKFSGYVLGFLIVASIAFHFWFKAHARQLIEDLVESRSNGKIRLQVDKFRFNWFSKKMEFEDAVFYSTDTATSATAYRFSVEKIRLKVDAVLPIVFNKRIIIDTLTLTEPEIRVTRLRRGVGKIGAGRKDVSLPEEMGNIYNSIQEALQVLRVSRFLIDRGTFVLENRIRPTENPVVIGNIFFQVDNLAVDTTIRGARDKILFSDNVILRSHDQDIVFPDERHRLSFSKFNINLQQKLVEFDSCTITALRTDSSSAAFTMYMDALKLIDIDFDTLYKAEVIKADSVYAMNPKFNLSVELGKKREGRSAPRLEDIIKSLTGDLMLDNVVVTNADFNINTIRDDVPTSYSFKGNNFDMQGLRIDQDAKSPIRVENFTMAIRDYENFIRDSSYRVQFDSVLFRDDRIYLSNFVFHKLDGGRILNTFYIPQFYLGGLSWDELVFERKLRADQATLFYPRIDYTVSDKLRSPGGSSNIFQSLASINEMMDLAYLDIIDGNIDLKVSRDVRVQLEQATLSIESRNLLQSTQLAGIKNSLTSLDFRNGTIRAGDIVMKLTDLRYIGEPGRLSASEIKVNDQKGALEFDLKDVYVDRMIVDEKRGDISSDNIRWGEGSARFRAGSGGKDLASIISLSNVKGNNTRLTTHFGNAVLSTFLRELSFDRLDKRPGSKMVLSGLNVSGENLSYRDGDTRFSADNYLLDDEKTAVINDVDFSATTENSETSFQSSQIRFVPFIQTYITQVNRFGDLQVESPRIRIVSNGRSATSKLPAAGIDRLRLYRPVVSFVKNIDGKSSSFEWDGSNTGEALDIHDLEISKENQSVNLGSLQFHLANAEAITRAAKKISTGSGRVTGLLENIEVKNDGNGSEWKADVKQLMADDLLFDSSGTKKNRLHIEKLALRDLGINTASVTNLTSLLNANRRFRISEFTGSLSNRNSILEWSGARLSRSENLFSLDSLSWEPHLRPDSFFAVQSFQKDYVTLKTGRVELQDADVDGFVRDQAIAGTELRITDLYLQVAKDTRLPRDSGEIKPLPVDLFRQIGVPLNIKRIAASRGNIDYTEISLKGNPVTIPITGVSMEMKNIKNMDAGISDSLDTRLSGTLLDSIRVTLHLRQSYFDSLSGFRLNAWFSPARMSVLNPATVPLGGIFIRSGEMDSASLSVTANEYLAFGEMKMSYRDLKVQLLKEGSELNGKNTKGLLSFLANTFVIRNHSKDRPAVIFVERNRNRSIFNYLVKIATRGFQTSIGVGRNRKLTRQYESRLKELGINPPGQD